MLQTATLSESTLVPAGAARDLPPGGRKLVFRPDGQTILLLNVEGEFYAMDNSCPHAGASMASGQCEGHTISCPAHGLKFNIKSGQCTASPGLLIPLYETLILEGELWLRLS